MSLMNKGDGVPETKSSNLNFIMGDRLVHYFIEKNWSPLKVGVAFYGLALLSSFLISLISGTLLPNPASSRTAFLEDEFYFLSETILVPVVWGFYLWICKSPKEVLSKLQEAEVLKLRDEDINPAKKILGNRWVIWMIAIIGLIAAQQYYFQYADFFPRVWYNTHLVFLLLRSVLVIFPAAFAGCSIIIRGVINVIVFKHILKGVNVNPLHPDRAGGLLPLGQYALTTTYLIALAGIVAAFAEYSAIQKGTFATATFFHLAIVVYIIAAPISFFAPLGTARSAMQEAKNSLMLRISKQFNQDYSLAFNELAGSAEELKERLDKVEQLQKMQKLTESFPIWPFDIETIRRFLFAITSPLIAIALSILSDILKDLILG